MLAHIFALGRHGSAHYYRTPSGGYNQHSTDLLPRFTTFCLCGLRCRASAAPGLPVSLNIICAAKLTIRHRLGSWRVDLPSPCARSLYRCVRTRTRLQLPRRAVGHHYGLLPTPLCPAHTHCHTPDNEGYFTAHALTRALYARFTRRLSAALPNCSRDAHAAFLCAYRHHVRLFRSSPTLRWLHRINK